MPLVVLLNSIAVSVFAPLNIGQKTQFYACSLTMYLNLFYMFRLIFFFGGEKMAKVFDDAQIFTVYVG